MANSTIRSQWSIASATSSIRKQWEDDSTGHHRAIDPLLTSLTCYQGLVNFFQNQSPFLLAVVTESSSHPGGLRALEAQPWVYGGGGLGNTEECPLQLCLAGGTNRDGFVFASACVVPECTAYDLAAEDFPAKVEEGSFQLTDRPDADIIQEYVTLHRRIAEVNKFLDKGWVCGEYKVPWDILPSFLYILMISACFACSIYATFIRRRKRRRQQQHYEHHDEQLHHGEIHKPTIYDKSMIKGFDILEQNDIQEEKKDASSEYDHIPYHHQYDHQHYLHYQQQQHLQQQGQQQQQYLQQRHQQHQTRPQPQPMVESQYVTSPANEEVAFWNAWDASKHVSKLFEQRQETAFLDGLKVGSILWIIFGHIVAIQSGNGPGYLNPWDLLPPKGYITTFFGQLLFGSRFAVDTFLCISGYLVVHVLKRKLSDTLDISRIFTIFIYRILRIWPLYVACMGFWILLAPHLGSGPFWYQWEYFLDPCREFWWTNILFVNNFIPWDIPTTGTCFYHSWYLAIDLQLFCLLAPWLVILYNKSAVTARRMVIFLWLVSVVVTAVLAYKRKWSVNTLDGMAVALFDIEGYAKPHVRAQSYLAGMYVAMMPLSSPSSLFSGLSGVSRRNHIKYMTLSIVGLMVTTFITVTGAYARRPCNYSELPYVNECGSTWSPTMTFIFSAFSRGVWSVCISIIMYLCLQRTRSENIGIINNGTSGNDSTDNDSSSLVGNFLSWPLWTPLAHLSFGVYLIHPIVIVMWQLSGHEKKTFHIINVLMDFTAVSVTSFILSAIITLVIEFPCSVLLRGGRRQPQQQRRQRNCQQRRNMRQENQNHDDEYDALISTSPPPKMNELSQRHHHPSYGAANGSNTHYG